jgi:hypothetical protein
MRSIDSSFLTNLVANDRYGFLTQPVKIQKFLTQPMAVSVQASVIMQDNGSSGQANDEPIIISFPTLGS